MSKKLEAFIALTKKIFVKKDKDLQMTLFQDQYDDPKKKRKLYLPVYGWKRK